LELRDARLLDGASEPDAILLIGDVNLGDSVNIQPVARVLRSCFPRARIDYVHSRTAAPLIRSNPHITESVPLFEGKFTPSEEEVRRLCRRIEERGYDLVLSFCPFLPERKLSRPGATVLSPLAFTCRVIDRAGRDGTAVAHLIPNMTGYVRELVSNGRPDHAGLAAPESATIYLSADVVERRDRWMAGQDVPPDSRPVFFNPDASNRFTMVPEELQFELLRSLLAAEDCGHLLLGSGFTFTGIERRLLERLPSELADRVTLVPTSLPIDVYAALTDACAVFITADTGPMHIAAARKECPARDGVFLNRTAVVGLFGPTLPRVYGYDSSRPGHLAANQDAPSRVFAGGCPRKSLVCSVERIGQACPGESCFRGLDVEEVARFVLRCVSDERTCGAERAAAPRGS
jgi:ADP-heptose:LPS heptosyltransferase